jgi:hypothetical protein
MPIPAGYRTVKQTQRRLVVTGLLLLGAGYATSAIGGALMLSSQESGGALAFIPVGGSFAAFSGFPGSAGVSSAALGTGEGNFLAGTLLGLGGVAQAVGLVTAVVGLVSPKTVLVPARQGFTLEPMPLLGSGKAGITLSGSF